MILSIVLMRRRPLRNSPGLVEKLPAVYTDLVQFKESADGLGVTLPGLVQQPTPLVQFFLFGMGGCPSFHLLKAFLHLQL